MEALPKSKNERLQGRAREVRGGEVEGVGVEGRVGGGAAMGFGTLVRVEGGWGGEGEGGVWLASIEFINARLKLVIVGFYSIVLVLEYIAHIVPIVDFSARPSDLKQILFLLGSVGLELSFFSSQGSHFLGLCLELALNGS